MGSSSTLIARASSLGDNLVSAGATVVFGKASEGTDGAAKNGGRGGAGAVSALLTSTLSAWKLYRSLEGSFGAEVFAPPNNGLVAEGGDNVVAGGGGVGLPLMGAVSSAGSIISAGRMIALEALVSSVSWTLDNDLAGGILRRLEGLSSSSRRVIVSTTLGTERIICVEPLCAEAKGSLTETSSPRVGFSISGGGLERLVPCETNMRQPAGFIGGRPTLGTVASIIACADISGSCSHGFSAGLAVNLGRFTTGFLTGAGGFTRLAVWYGLETSGFFAGVTSLMSSVIKSAARVGRKGG